MTAQGGLHVVRLNDEPEPDIPDLCLCVNDSNRRRLFPGPGNIEPLRPPRAPVQPKPKRRAGESAAAFKKRMKGFGQHLLGYLRTLAVHEALMADGFQGYCKNCGILVTRTGRPAERHMPCELYDCLIDVENGETH